MKRRDRRPTSELGAAVEGGASVEMTPLIDVTFQLLVFLLVINDVSAKVTEDVTLPVAEHATEIEADEGIVTVNVLAQATPADSPRVRIGGLTVQLREMARLLQTVADLHRPPLDPAAVSRAGVLVRADRDAPWRHVQLVMQACADERIRIVRIQFATRAPDAESDLAEDAHTGSGR